jgi:LPPG:FO 2-phospho-L-lactate transferase
MKVVALAGGTGAAKFLRGLYGIADRRSLVVVGNTGDDLELWGLSISPDLDTVTYTLAGLVDDSKGWGIQNDTFECLAAMASFGGETFFALGDRDLALHLHRSERLRAGASLSRVTDEARLRLGVESRIIPMSDDGVKTCVRIPEGWLDFQEFFVRERSAPEVLDVEYRGAERARPAPGVLEAIHEADAVVVCPSNPISSIGPILAVPGIRGALAETRAPVVAISPIVGTAPVSGPAGKMMRAKGFDVSVLGVLDAYAEILDVLVIDERDRPNADAIRSRGVRPAFVDIMMVDRARETSLARATLEAVG